ncbi:MAG: type II toxin-antitoxin system VapB family antitoxin [Sporichthyaceae bacterium]
MARTVLDLDDAALARAAAILGTTTKVETVNRALRLVAESGRDDAARQRFRDLVLELSDQLAECDVRGQAWR